MNLCPHLLLSLHVSLSLSNLSISFHLGVFLSCLLFRSLWLSPVLIVLNGSQLFQLCLSVSQCLFLFLSEPWILSYYSHILHPAREAVQEPASAPTSALSGGRSGRQAEQKSTFPTHWVDRQGLGPGLGTVSTATFSSSEFPPFWTVSAGLPSSLSSLSNPVSVSP